MYAYFMEAYCLSVSSNVLSSMSGYSIHAPRQMGAYTIHPLVTICMYCYSVSYDLYEWFLYLVVLHVMEPKPIVELHTF